MNTTPMARDIHDAHSLSELMAAGDSACRDRRADVLSQAAALLARCLAAPLQVELQDIAIGAWQDLESASRQWALLRDRVRDQLALPARPSA